MARESAAGPRRAGRRPGAAVRPPDPARGTPPPGRRRRAPTTSPRLGERLLAPRRCARRGAGPPRRRWRAAPRLRGRAVRLSGDSASGREALLTRRRIGDARPWPCWTGSRPKATCAGGRRRPPAPARGRRLSPSGRELRAGSRGFLQPWEPTWPADDLTRAAFRRRLTAYARDMRAGAWPIRSSCSAHSDDALVGGITLSNIRRGVAQMGSIGYWVRPALRPAGPHPGGGHAR